MNILDLIQQETRLTFAKRGKEHHGQCPFCRCEGNHFVVFTTGEQRYWCRQCEKKGDSIQFLRDYSNYTYRQAKERLGLSIDNDDYHDKNDNHDNHDNRSTSEAQPVTPPGQQWQFAAMSFVEECQAALWSEAGARARAWLHEKRRLTNATIRQAGLGYNDHDYYVDRQGWGLPPEISEHGKQKGLWLPRGIVIPWWINWQEMIDGEELWGVRIRRPATPEDKLKYYFVPGGQASALYNADQVTPGQPALIFEGEIDALTSMQEAEIASVATGSTHGARRIRWVSRLSTASTVLVCYDSDDAGNKTAQYWIDGLPNAKRWRPWWSDANDLLVDGVDVGAWVRSGLGEDAPQPIALPTIGDLTDWSGQGVDVDAGICTELTHDDALASLSGELQALFLEARKRSDADFDARLRARKVQ